MTAQQHWNALTDEDRDRAFNRLDDGLQGFMKLWGWLHYAKAIEEICREKNAPSSGDGRDAERHFSPEFEVWQDDMMVASACGPREDAYAEAMRYAEQYGQDGPVRVFEVQRTLMVKKG